MTLVLLVLSGCASESAKEKQYVQNMIEIIEEVDSEMKELSKSITTTGEVEADDFSKMIKQKQKEVREAEVPNGLPKSVKDCEDNLYDGMEQISTAIMNNDPGSVETGQFNLTVSKIIYEGFLNGSITKESDDGKTETERSKEWEDALVKSRKKTVNRKDYYGEWESDKDSDTYINLSISKKYVEDINNGTKTRYTFDKVRTIKLNVKQMRVLFGDENISDGTMMIMIGEKDKDELSIAGHYYDGDGKKQNLLSNLVKVEESVTESTSYDRSSEVREETESTQNKSNPMPMPRDPAELAGTGTPKGYHEFNADQQKAIGKAVDAVTNNVGVDRTMYNYTVEPDVLSGTIYVGRFDGTELMDVITLDDKLLDYKGILDAKMFSQLKNQTIEQFVNDYSLGSANCTLGEKDGRVVIYFTMEEKHRTDGDEKKIQQYIELTRRVSNDVNSRVRAGVPVSLQEPFESDYSVTFVDGRPTSATKAYQSVIDKMNF
ncbi:hypothetical protein RV02_GL000862 [Enterococcus gilvus]|nr:hypothetical protein RV02_GL000862 [Enterococcus gilvus]